MLEKLINHQSDKDNTMSREIERDFQLNEVGTMTLGLAILNFQRQHNGIDPKFLTFSDYHLSLMLCNQGTARAYHQTLERAKETFCDQHYREFAELLEGSNTGLALNFPPEPYLKRAGTAEEWTLARRNALLRSQADATVTGFVPLNPHS